jgi:predicted GIY-YIG superfamily endonuclease
MAPDWYPADDAPGTIYLLHYSGRTKHRHQHYLGWSADVERRYAQHRSGRGSSETKKAVAEGLEITVAQTWKGTPLLERRLKEWSRKGCKGFAGICPFCPKDDVLPSDLISARSLPLERGVDLLVCIVLGGSQLANVMVDIVLKGSVRC